MRDKFFKSIAFNIDDEVELNEEIYSQFARSTAKLMDIDFAKTPVVDLFTGYQRCFVLEDRIKKAIECMNNTFNITSVKDMVDLMNKIEEILKGSD